MQTAPHPAVLAARSMPGGTGWPSPDTPGHATAGGSATARLAAGQGANRAAGRAGERAGSWLRVASAGLVLLAAAAAAVSFSAQYRMMDAARPVPVIAGLEAAIPDAAALVFACLGIAMALHGRRAVRARFLNLAAVGTSVFMNAIAAAPGWRGLAIWVMPPVAYALVSDTLIGVVRAHALARCKDTAPGFPGDDATPLTSLGSALLWPARLVLAPPSTLAGLRARVLAACPVPPRTVADRPARHQQSGGPQRSAHPSSNRRPGLSQPDASPLTRPADKETSGRAGTKTAQFLALAEREHGPLAAVPLASVGRISAALAPQAGLHPGSARTALRRAILTARDGSPS